MLNTVLQQIEEYESSASFGSNTLPASIYEENEEEDTNVLIVTDDDSSNDSFEYTDANISSASDDADLGKDPFQIKQTLKDKIRTRRESEGVGEITNLFEPPKQYELTPEEEAKNEIRKQRNRRSATKSRLKRIAHEKKLEENAEKLEKEFQSLKSEVNLLQKAKQICIQVLAHHLPTCQRRGATPDARAVRSKVYTNTSATQAAGEPKITAGASNGLPRLQSPLLTSVVQRAHNSSQIQWPVKRKSTDEVFDRSFKIPKVPNQTVVTNQNSIIQRCTNTNLNAVCQSSTYTAAETITYNPPQSENMETRTGVQCNTGIDSVLCEIPNPDGNIQSPFPEITNSQKHFQYGTSVCNNTEKDSVDINFNTFVTEEQEINLIKQHLLDGFPMASDS